MKIEGRSCETAEFVVLTLENGTIARIESSIAPEPPDEETVWISPGFIDIQVNGYAGFDFNIGAWGDADEVAYDPEGLVRILAESGTTQICPTITTNSCELILTAFRRLTKSISASLELNDAMPCFHLEGPYLSPEDGPRGAHPAKHIREPDWDEFRRFQEVANGRIGICTVAPEVPGALRFIEQLAESGVVAAIGHTAAEPQTIREAVSAGAKLTTHLGNGAKALLPRHPNFIWEQLACDELFASVIADGDHLPDAVLKVFSRAKTARRMILVSDAVALGGLAPGSYCGGRFKVLESGKIVVAGTPYLAGAGRLLNACIPILLRASDMTLPEVIRSASSIPASLLGLESSKGRLKVGFDADIVQFQMPENAPLKIIKTIRGGR